MICSSTRFDAKFKTGEAHLRDPMREHTVYETYAGTPVGNVTPDFIGQVCLDTSNSRFYMAYGTTSSSWKLMSSDLSATEQGYVDGVTPGTATASKALVLDSDGEINKIKISNQTADSLYAVENHGMTGLRGDSGDSKKYYIDAPEEGVDKILYKAAGDSDSSPIAIFGDSDDSIKVGASSVQATFDSAAFSSIHLRGYSATKWIIVSTYGGVTLA